MYMFTTPVVTPLSLSGDTSMAYEEDVEAKILPAMPLMNLPKNHIAFWPGMRKNSKKIAAIETMYPNRRHPRRL
jgi:hypothetical protein